MAKINTVLLMYHEANRYSAIFNGCPELDTKRLHVENVIKNISTLIEALNPQDINKDLLVLCAEHHDDGRVDQLRLLGKFWDTEVTHQSLGVDRFYRWLHKSSYVAPVTAEQIQIFLDVMQYHGRPELCINKASKPYVELVTAADDLENAAACVSYLLREVRDDAKGYRHDYPEADQTFASDFVFTHFKNGEKFDKLKYCHTYAEYVLFAATLMTSCIKKYDFAKSLLLQPGYGYSSILEGYKDVFYKTLNPELANRAYKVLCSYAYAEN